MPLATFFAFICAGTALVGACATVGLTAGGMLVAVSLRCRNSSLNLSFLNFFKSFDTWYQRTFLLLEKPPASAGECACLLVGRFKGVALGAYFKKLI